MKMYRIEGGVAHVGAGEVVQITEAQYKPRAHNVDVLEHDTVTGDYVVRANTVIQFKAGEIVGLALDPPKSMAHLFVDKDAPPPPPPPEKPAGKVTSISKARRR